MQKHIELIILSIISTLVFELAFPYRWVYMGSLQIDYWDSIFYDIKYYNLMIIFPIWIIISDKKFKLVKHLIAYPIIYFFEVVLLVSSKEQIIYSTEYGKIIILFFFYGLVFCSIIYFQEIKNYDFKFITINTLKFLIAPILFILVLSLLPHQIVENRITINTSGNELIRIINNIIDWMLSFWIVYFPGFVYIQAKKKHQIMIN